MKRNLFFLNDLRSASLAAIGLLCLTSPLDAATVSLEASGDVTLINGAANINRNYGGSTELWVMPDQQNTYIRFDLGGIGVSEITSLTLGLYLKSFGADGTSMTIFFRAPDSGNLDWVEGTGGNHPNNSDATGSSTWSHRIYDATNPVAWVGASGGGANAGTKAQLSFSSTDAAGYREVTFTDSELLAQWLEAGEVNLVLSGWKSASLPNLRAVFGSREGSEGERPYLKVSYESIPEPGTAALLGGGTLALFAFWRRKGI